MGTQDSTRPAARITLSYPADLGAHSERRIQQEYYKTYLRKVKDRAEPGDEWREFTDVGCCGSQREVPLAVEAVEGGARVTDETSIEYTEREACGLDSPWSVQYDEPGSGRT